MTIYRLIIIICCALFFKQISAQSFILPSNNLVQLEQAVSFNWNTCSENDNYELQIAEESSYNNPTVFYINNSDTTLSFTPNQYFARYRCEPSGEWSASRSFTIVDLSTLGNMVLWLDASDASNVLKDMSNNVSSWVNKVDAGISFDQANASAQPTWIAQENTLNNKALLRFDGNNDFLNAGDTLDIDTNSISLFIVGKNNATTNSRFFAKALAFGSPNRISFGQPGGGNFNLLYHDNSFKTLDLQNNFSYRLYGLLANRSPTERWLNVYSKGDVIGSLNSIASNTYSFNSNFRFLLGAYNNTSDNGEILHLNGDIAEFIIYHTALEDSTRNLVEQYLRYKYTPPLNLGRNIQVEYGFCDTTIDAQKPWFVSYLWSTGETSPAITANQPGTYVLTVTDVFGYESSDSINITYPIINQSISDTILCFGDSVAYNAGLSNTNYTFLWQDGSSDSIYIGNQPEEIYFTVSDTNSCVFVSDTFEVAIDSFALNLSIGSDTNLCVGNSIGLISGGALAENFLWNTGDTTASISVSTSDIYTLIANNQRGCVYQDSIEATIIGVAPVTTFEFDTVCLGASTSFVNTSSAISPIFINQYLWVVEGDSFSTENVAYLFDSVGVYEVYLQTTSNVGCKAALTQSVEVRANPQAAFNLATDGCINNAYVFESQSTTTPLDSIVDFIWSFGDGQVGIMASSQNTYLNTGMYEVVLEISTALGCIDSVAKTLNVVSTAPEVESVKLKSLLNNYVGIASNQTFSWYEVDNAAQYELEIASDESFSNLYTTISTSDTFAIVNNIPTQTWYWRVLSNNICGEASESLVRTFTIIDISTLGNMVLWLDASDESNVVKNASNEVSSWVNKVDTGISFDQANASAQPLWVAEESTLNNKSLLRFDGNNDFLNGGDTLDIDTNSVSIFFVGKNNSTAGSRFFAKALAGNATNRISFGQPGGGNFNLLYHDNSLKTLDLQNNFSYRLYGLLANRSPTERWLNVYSKGDVIGSLNSIASNTYSFNSNFRFLLGAYNNATDNGQIQYLNGDIAEFIIYHTALEDSTRNLVEQYLRYKYAPPVNLGPDIFVDYGFCSVDVLGDNKPWFTSYSWSTGDNSINTTVSQTGTYILTVTDVFGYESSDSIKVTFPNQDTKENYTVCLSDSLNIDLFISDDYTYVWNGTDTVSSFSFFEQGTYQYAIFDTLGCFLMDSFNLVVDSVEVAFSLGGDTTLCSGNELNIANVGNFPVVSYLWSTGDNTASAIVGLQGEYWVQVENENGCVASDTIFVSILGIAPTADFTNSPACIDAETQFFDTSSSSGSNIISWNWDFGNDSTSSLQNPINIYTAQNIYFVSLNIETNEGCINNTTKILAASPQPNVAFENQIVCEGSNTTFLNSSIVNTPNFIDSTFWDFGNGDVSSNFNGSTQYNNEGEFVVSLTAFSDAGCQNTSNQVVEVFPAFIPNFEVENLCFGDSVKFLDATTSLSNVDWLWNFGVSNAFSFQANPNFLYNSPGEYNVTLTVQNAIGCESFITKTIEILEPPIIVIENDSACSDESIDVWYVSSIVSNDSIISSIWQIDTAIFQNFDTVSLYLFNENNLTVELSITTKSGCVSSANKEITVYQKPIIDFNFDPNYGTAPIDIQFENLSNGLTSFIWDFGDNSSQVNQENPQHTYLENGEYIIQFIGFNEFGCSNVLQKTIPIVPSALDIELRNISLQIEDLNNGTFKISTSLVLFNNGTRIIERADLQMQLDGQSRIVETWTGNLNIGNATLYNFNAFYEVSELYDAQRICVEAKNVNDGTEIKIDNNKVCALIKGLFSISNPYPNPANNNINLDLTTADPGQVNIQVYNIEGKLNWEIIDMPLTKGINKLSLDVSNYSSGKYFFSIRYLNTDYTIPFAVVRD